MIKKSYKLLRKTEEESYESLSGEKYKKSEEMLELCEESYV